MPVNYRTARSSIAAIASSVRFQHPEEERQARQDLLTAKVCDLLVGGVPLSKANCKTIKAVLKVNQGGNDY